MKASDQKSKRERIHDAGAKRHRQSWYNANLAASHATFGYGLDDEQLKEMVPLIVLRVLDAIAYPTQAGATS